MTANSRVREILRILKATYPDVRTPLAHRNPLQLLIATILSAQCRDEKVNEVTERLFERLKTRRQFIEIPLTELEALIRPTGFYKNKAKSIKGCCAAIGHRHNGRVPERLEELVRLPGVGRKTANVVLGSAFGIPGIVVDTHVKRVSSRLGLTKETSPAKIETDLMEIVPKKLWNDFSLQLIFHGRKVCKARRPECAICPLRRVCKQASS
ncbi:MAG: endonuclease III [Deltaproteobacteria bacterium]|jgi:endonuclease-3|nr:endonuclease III [Deltaproteobacteria bacterium]